MTTLHVVRVFVGRDGAGGNPLGVFLAGAAVPQSRRQAVAADLGFSETVFVDDTDSGDIRIFTPVTELPFAGHPVIGTAWVLHEQGWEASALHPPAGEIPVWRADGLTWMRARAEWSPQRDVHELATAADVERLDGPEDGAYDLYAWAWIDEGTVRARYFAPGLGIAEDEATGSAAVVLGDRLGRDIAIRQGVGSEIVVRPHSAGVVDVGGRVELLRTDTYP